jgi:peptidoglycan hydrolase-like amidase
LLDLHGAAPLSEGTSKTRNRSLDAIRPTSELAISMRVGLLSRSPIQFLRTSLNKTCQLADGSFIAVDQLLDVTADLSNSARYCKSGVVEITGDSFEGSLELVRSNNGWLAVNEVSLENYESSVVGAKRLSHCHGEALKAQALAASSYAASHLTRPALQTYHPILTQQFLRATDETGGNGVSYRGGLVESLNASTQAISEEAHRHLGASMSQHGAQRLATQGLRFDEILERYYQGASLAQRQRDGS